MFRRLFAIVLGKAAGKCMNSHVGIDGTTQVQIRVEGRVNQQLAQYLGMSVTGADDDDRPVSIVSGPIVDQAALLGVLNALYDMGFPLLSLECQSVRMSSDDEKHANQKGQKK
jgi:hypothetical protein